MMLTKRTGLYVGFRCNIQCAMCFVDAPGLGLPSIQTKRGVLKMNQVIEGDEVLTTHKKTGKLVWTSVTKVITQSTEDFYRIRTRSGKVYNVTGEHPFWVIDKGWVQAKHLTIIDDLLYVRGRELTSFLKKSGYISPGTLKEEIRNKFSERMKRYNPMFNKEVAERASSNRDYKAIGQKISNTKLLRYGKKPKYKRPRKGFSDAERDRRRQYMIRHNPMRNQTSKMKALITRQRDQSLLEKKFESLCVQNNFPVKFVGNGTFWLRRGTLAINPDFKVNGETKVIETYDSRYKERGTNGYPQQRKRMIESFGYECLMVDMNRDKAQKQDIPLQVRNFISNGDRIISIEHIKRGQRYHGRRRFYEFGTPLRTINFSCSPQDTFLANRTLVHNCYYAEPHWTHSEWFPLEKLKGYALLFREKYGNEHVDITGGEPTIYPMILPLVQYCREIGLKPTLITNMQVLDRVKVKQFKDAGIEDFLCSILALEAKYDQLVKKPGAFAKAVKALKAFGDEGVSFRVNCVLTSYSCDELWNIAYFVKHQGAKVLNFISYNPFYEWSERKDQDFQVKHSSLMPKLKEALSYCDENKLEANVRYMPFCFLDGHQEKCYNYSQLSYDPGEWSYPSWYSPRTDSPSGHLPEGFWDKFQSIEEGSYHVALGNRKALYQFSEKCVSCANVLICDGLTKQYFARYGDNELMPVEGETIKEPNFFIKERKKYLWSVDNGTGMQTPKL